jgi:hypothetical protein
LIYCGSVEGQTLGTFSASWSPPQGPANLIFTNFSNIRRRDNVDKPFCIY